MNCYQMTVVMADFYKAAWNFNKTVYDIYWWKGKFVDQWWQASKAQISGNTIIVKSTGASKHE